MNAMDLDWGDNGLVAAIIQDAASGRVLMLGYMNPEALERTKTCRQVTFYSRRRKRLWTKGETSGNFLDVVSITRDCDGDALLFKVRPRGATCHLGTQSCFADIRAGTIDQLDALIADRDKQRPSGSYTTSLFEQGVRRIAQKVGEEGVEIALAAVSQDDAELIGEAADLVFHLLALLRARGLGLTELETALAERLPSEAP